MTPDEPPIPDDDALAGAARRALGRLSDDGVPVAPWEDVRARGRRTQRTRAAVAIAAALLVVVAGAGGVSALHGKGDHVDVAGTDHGGTTTTTTTEPPSTTTTTTTPTAPPVTTPMVGGTTPTAPLPEAQAADLTGAITLASTTWIADEPALASLTVQNVSGHPVEFPKDITRLVGLYVDTLDVALFGSNSQAPLAPGEQRTFAGTITPRPQLIGPAQVSAGYLRGVALGVGAGLDAPFTAVAPVAIMVVPPGWSAGDPLDPARGNWTVGLAVAGTTVTSGRAVTFHATVTNTGDQPQHTNAYDALSLTCTTGGETGGSGQFLPAAIIAPGASQTFDVDLPFALPSGTAQCFVGVAFPPLETPSTAYTSPHAGLTSDVVELTVQPAETTTSGP